MFLKEIIDSVASNAICIEIKENNREVTLSFRFSRLRSDADRLSDALNYINKRDSFSLKIALVDTDQALILSDKDLAEVQRFLQKIELYGGLEEDSEGTISLKVTKEVAENRCSVYSLDHIAKHWSSGSMLDSMSKISALAKQTYRLECHEITSTFKTGLFVFSAPTQTSNTITNPEPSFKYDRIKAREKVCVFYQHDDFPFIPEDFYFDTELCNAEIQSLFDRIRLALCLIYLCDSARFNSKGDLSLSLTGYKHISYVLDGLSINLAHTSEYYELYQWAYNEGNVSDKVGLCRNVLSIHVEEDNLSKLRPGCVGAATSNYAIYLKENLKQYVDIKSKINEQVQKSSEKASDLVKSIGTYLKGSIFSLYSFVFSVFLIRTLAKSAPQSDTGLDLPMISTATYSVFLLFTLLSLLVLGFAVLEMNSEIKRFGENYDALKKRYNDLITDTDLSQILQNDSQYKLDILYLKTARKRAVTLWISSVIAIFAVISTIYVAEL